MTSAKSSCRPNAFVTRSSLQIGLGYKCSSIAFSNVLSTSVMEDHFPFRYQPTEEGDGNLSNPYCFGPQLGIQKAESRNIMDPNIGEYIPKERDHFPFLTIPIELLSQGGGLVGLVATRNVGRWIVTDSTGRGFLTCQ